MTRSLLRLLEGGILLLFIAAMLITLFVRLRPPPAEAPHSAVIEFRTSLVHPSLEGALCAMKDASLGGKPVTVKEVRTRARILSPRETGDFRFLPSASEKIGEGTLLARGFFRDGSFFIGGDGYLAPGMSMLLEDKNAVFLVQILSISDNTQGALSTF